MGTGTLKVAILASGEGTNAERLIQAAGKRADIEVAVVASNRSSAGVLRRSEALGVETWVFSKAQLNGGVVAQELVQNCDNPICRVRLVAKNGVTACARVAVVVTACAAVAVVARSSGLVSCAPWVSRSQCGRMLISTDLGHGNVVVVIVVTWTDPGLRPFLHGRRSRLTARDLAKTDEVSSFREMHVLFTYCAERGAPPLRSWCERFPLRSTSSKFCRAPVLRG